MRQGYVAWSNGEPVEKETDEYQAYAWNYSGKGYLFLKSTSHPGMMDFQGIRLKSEAPGSGLPGVEPEVYHAGGVSAE